MSAMTRLVERNGVFAANGFPSGLTMMPRLATTVIGCLDPRVDPAHVLGLELGDAAVIRNVGGRVTPAVLEMLGLLALGFPALETPRPIEDRMSLVVLQHADCGIARMQGAPGALASYLGVDPSQLAAAFVADPRAAVAVDLARLQANPRIAAAYAISGLVYDVATGQVEVVDTASAAA